MTRWKLAIGAGCLVIAFAAGRYTARKPDVTATEKIRTQTVEVFSSREEWVTRRDTETTHDEVTIRVVGPSRRTVTDAGTVEEHAGLVEVTASAERAKEVVSAAGKQEEGRARVEVREVERRVEVRTPLPDWRIGAAVAHTDAGFSYGPQASWRIVGPVYATGAVTFGAERVAVVGLGLEF